MRVDLCPGSEGLAELVEGRLQGARREELLAHVAACEDCYTVYAETLRFLETAPPTARAATADIWSRALRVLLPLAAAAVLTVVVFGPGAPPDPVALLLAASGPQGLPGDAWDEQPLAYGFAASADSGRSFLLGVEAVDVALALALDPHGAGRERLEVLRQRVEAGAFGTQPVEHYRRLEQQLRDGSVPRPEQLVPAAGVDREAFQVGRWVEACRRAAVARREAFLTDAHTRAVLERLELPSTSAPARREWAVVRTILGRDRRDDEAWQRLERALAQLIRLAGGA